jgi:hypothetical protein
MEDRIVASFMVHPLLCSFKDAVLDMTENTKEKVRNESLRANVDFFVNRPFFFIVEMDHDILALGRIKDPTW